MTLTLALRNKYYVQQGLSNASEKCRSPKALIASEGRS